MQIDRNGTGRSASGHGRKLADFILILRMSRQLNTEKRSPTDNSKQPKKTD
jgi:hypothetical protein